MSEELLSYSDHRLHDFALQHGLTKFVLSDEAVMASGKCQLLVELLEDLQVQSKLLFVARLLLAK